MTVVRGVALGLAALIALPVVGANHVQPVPLGGTVTFRDKAGGNEWWVEAVVTSSVSVSKVEVMDTDGAWATMTYHPEWGSWAASYHVEPGHLVSFRATTPNGVAYSCPFTHPAGVEQCTTPPPPPPWTTRTLADSHSIFLLDLSIGDADRDGRNELYATGADLSDTGQDATGLEQVRLESNGWQVHEVPTPSMPSAIAVGDGDNDGKAELYVGGNGTVDQYVWTGAAWTRTPIAILPVNATAISITLGDVDRDGRREVYYAVHGELGDGGQRITDAYQVKWGADGAWQMTPIGRLTGWGQDTWIGDGDRDGQVELYVGTSDVVGSIRFTGTFWSTETVTTTGALELVAGDGDRDGKGEVYYLPYNPFTYEPQIHRVVKTAAGWTDSTIVTYASGAPADLFLGDADNDASQELYVADTDGAIEQVRWNNAAWQRTTLSPATNTPDAMLVVGDADGDRLNEVYATRDFGTCSPGDPCGVHYQQVLNHPPALPPPPPGTFDATFSGVRGNEYWVQANVAATGGTLAKVDVRLNNGAWQPLAKQSWGGWAASYRIVQGTVVQLRATSTGGATDLSDCYQWIPASNTDATKVACSGSPPPPPPPPPSFSATFTLVTGNEWWEQAQVTPSSGNTVASVEVRIHTTTWGPWSPLTLQSWGVREWAGSYHAPQGSVVEFRATSTTGAVAQGGCYQWIPPQGNGATATSVACPA